MFDTRKALLDHRLLDVIKIIAANGETGRLQMAAGTAEGAFLFKNGQLVDARVGHLTGFQAVNAVASMRNASFNFDPSVAPPLVSPIKPNERVVLKQFFGIETFAPPDVDDEVVYSDDEEVTREMRGIPVEAIPIQEIRVEPMPVEALPDPLPEMPVEPMPVEALPDPLPETPSSRSFYRGGLIVALVFVLMVVAAVALRNKYRERAQTLSASVATAEQPPARAVPAAVVTTEQPAAPPVAEKVKPNNTEVKSNNTEVKASKPEVKSNKPEVQPNKPSTDVAQHIAAQDLSGKWNVVNTVEKTSYRSYQNMKIAFDLSISQNGKSFTGKGIKISENGRSLPADSRTPIRVKGSIDGDRVEATFFEDGSMRKTNGRFVWRIDKTGALTGTFNSTAAQTSGKSAARKS